MKKPLHLLILLLSVLAFTQVQAQDNYPRNKFRQHIVKWYEDIYTIAEKYSISAEDLMTINGLESHRLQTRQKLWIPKSPEITREYLELLAAKDTEKDNQSDLEHESDTLTMEEVILPQRKDTVNLALMLPMNSTGNISSGNMDFYSGALLAARDMGQSGINVNLNVFDINDNLYPIGSDDFRNADVVIGPISVSEINRNLHLNTDSTIVVSPLDPKAESLALTNPSIIHAPASAMTQYEDLVSWIKEESVPGDSVLVIYEKGSNDMAEGSSVRTMLDNTGLRIATFSYNILDGREITDNLKKLSSPLRQNKVLVVSEREAFVNDVVRNLNVLIHEKYNVVLYAPSKIRSFETIEIDNLHNTNLHCSLSYYVDYDSEQVKKFLMTYRALYNTEPTPFAYQGYDLASYFIKTIAENGPAWKERLTEQRSRLLQSDFMFNKAPENGGWINKGIRRVVYLPDYKVKLLD